jgi:hypothetical protein
MPTMRLTSLALFLLLSLSAPALAQLAPAAPPADPTESAEYKQAVEQALEEYRLGHFEEARSLFQRAHDIDANARTLRGLGMVEFELRHYVRAAELLEQSLGSTNKPLTDEQRKSVAQLLERTRQFIAQYELSVEPARTDITVELDGKPVKLGAEGRLSLEAGEHTLRISGPELSSRELKLDVKGGEQQTLRIELEVKQPEPKAPATPVVSKSEPPPLVHPHKTPGIVLIAVGGAALVAGGVMGGLALGQADSAKTRSDSDADGARSMALGSDIAIGVGVASVAVGVVLWALKRPAERTATSALRLDASRLRVSF